MMNTLSELRSPMSKSAGGVQQSISLDITTRNPLPLWSKIQTPSGKMATRPSLLADLKIPNNFEGKTLKSLLWPSQYFDRRNINVGQMYLLRYRSFRGCCRKLLACNGTSPWISYYICW